MTNTGSAPETAETASPEETDTIPSVRRTPSPVGSVLARSLWFGTWVGGVTAPFVAFAAMLLASLGAGSAGDWLFGIVFIVWAFLPLVGVGAGIGLCVGAGSGAAVLVALWLEARSVWRVGAGVRVASAAAGALVGGAIVLPVAVAFFSQAAFAVPYVLVAAVLLAGVVASRQGPALDKIRLRSAPFAARSAGGRMPRARIFRVVGSVITLLLVLALVELAAALPRVTAYSTCGDLGEQYLSRVDFGLWPPQLTCVFVDESLELVPRALYVVASAIALLAAGLLVTGVVGALRVPHRAGRSRLLLSLMGPIGMALLALGLASVTAVGAFGPAAGRSIHPTAPTGADRGTAALNDLHAERADRRTAGTGGCHVCDGWPHRRPGDPHRDADVRGECGGVLPR